MIKYPVYNQRGEVIKELQLPAKVFGVKVNADLVQQAAVAQRANFRQVLAHTKGRAEVRGGGKKPWRQKGTGRARVGSSRSPLWRSGGITFGPTKERNFSKNLNDKMRRQALLMALSEKVATKDLAIVDKLELAAAKTKAFNQILTKLESKLWPKAKRSLLLVQQGDTALWRAGRNLPYLRIINLDNLNLLDVLQYRQLLLSEAVVGVLTKRYAKN